VKNETARTAVRHLRPVPSPPGLLENLFNEHNARVFRAAYRITGSATDAEDVLQTVFLRLASQGEEIDLAPNPGSYLHRAAINASLDLLRRRSRFEAVPLEAVPGGEERFLDTQGVEAELRSKIRESVARLGPRASEVVSLKYFEGYGNREIASMLGTTSIAVGVVLHRARRQLRKEIAKFLEGHHEANQ
jgi:RNA polymerase sigma-70 factor (ECF subfamily)